MGRTVEEIYLAVWKDTSRDDTHHAFILLDDAISWCKGNSKPYKNYKFYELAEASGRIDGTWLFWLTSEFDGPYFYVVRIPLF